MGDRMITETEKILLACDARELASRFAEILGIGYDLTFASTWHETIESITCHPYPLLLLDPALLPATEDSGINEIFTVSPDTRLLLLETTDCPVIDQMALFKMGVHGFCRSDMPPELLVKAVNAVSSGELWIQRSLITQVIDELAHGRSPAVRNKIKCLTPRELEVARMVHMGGNNKSIARELDISERTVKAHLSAIFRKLEIENRLHLALFFNDVS
jgi:DNA-binding NarL/FixJ family response regulator